MKGWYVTSEHSRPVLRGMLTARPYVVRETLCLMETHWIVRLEGDTAFESANRGVPEYGYWKRESETSCPNITDRSQVSDVVIVRDRIPAAAVETIIFRADELLELAKHNPMCGEKRSIFPDDVSFRLWEISLTWPRLGSDRGIAYQASFTSPGRGRGPMISFSLVAGEFEIHSVCQWLS